VIQQPSIQGINKEKKMEKRKGIFSTYLDPGAIFGEILFGLIMVLTFTLGAGLTVEDGPEAVHMLLIAALGCNIAWGIIDGALYLMGIMLDRGRRNRMLLSLKNIENEDSAIEVISKEFDGPLISLTTEEERTSLYRSIWRVSARSQPEKPRVHRDDIIGSLLSGILVILTTLPAAIPFMFMEHAHLALRTSNGILIASLFFCGFFWAKYTGANRWVAGVSMMLIGLALVQAAIMLGG